MYIQIKRRDYCRKAGLEESPCFETVWSGALVLLHRHTGVDLKKLVCANPVFLNAVHLHLT
jgi:hypothetical protein